MTVLATSHGPESVVAFLQAQRSSVLAIVEGLDEVQARRSVVPSGWTPLGMVQHLTGAEWHWFERVIAGFGDPLDDARDHEPFTSDRASREVVADYRNQIARSDKILSELPLDTAPIGRSWPAIDEIHTVRDVVLHMIEETARHAGHLDIARELIDGSTGLGPR